LKENKKTNKPKIMLHYVKPGSLGGPNILYKRIENSTELQEKYDFVPLNQDLLAGGKINIKLILKLKKLIKKENPDIIIISGMQSTGFHCMIAAILAGCKNRIITTHGFSGDDLGLSNIKRFVFNSLIEPLTLILATRVQGISKYTIEKPMVRKYGKNKTSFIYNFPPSKEETSKEVYVRKELGIGNEEVVFTTVSRVVFDKGYKELSEAIEKLKEVENIRFLIVGEGKYEETFKRLVKEEIQNKKVIMLGKRTDVMNILKESDVFVLPTLHENLGNVFLEASAVKIPSIGTRVGGVPEIIIPGETGFLVPPFDSEKLAAVMLKLFNDSSLRKTLGEKAYVRLKTVFNPKDIEKQFDELFVKLLKES